MSEFFTKKKINISSQEEIYWLTKQNVSKKKEWFSTGR
jgi:hypothetical protein